ncbi:MAG: hypothetical protein RIR26_963 [Pseudomonadota bacterium]
MKNRQSQSLISLSLLALAATLGACSSQMSEYAGADSLLRAKRASGADTGDLNPPVSAGGSIDAAAAVAAGATLPAASVYVPPKEGSSAVSASGSEDASKKESDDGEREEKDSEDDHSDHSSKGKRPSKSSESKVDEAIEKALLGACLAKVDPEHKFPSYKLVSVEEKNANKDVLYEDSESGEGSLILLRVRANNLNKAQINMLNPKSTYCVDIEAKNMNKFTFSMACEAKVGFVKLENKNDNKLSTVVKQAVCE